MQLGSDGMGTSCDWREYHHAVGERGRSEIQARKICSREERDSIAVGIHTDGNIMRSKGISCGRRGKLTGQDGEGHPKMGLQVGCRDRIRPMGGRRACDREQWKKNHATWVVGVGWEGLDAHRNTQCEFSGSDNSDSEMHPNRLVHLWSKLLLFQSNLANKHATHEK